MFYFVQQIGQALLLDPEGRGDHVSSTRRDQQSPNLRRRTQPAVDPQDPAGWASFSNAVFFLFSDGRRPWIRPRIVPDR